MSQGHIRKRGKTWSFIVELPGDPETGKRKQRWVSGFKTKAAAGTARNEILRQLESGTYVEPVKTTVEEFLTKQWLPTKGASVRLSTKDSYAANIRLHVVPRLGHVQIQILKPTHLNSLYAHLLTDRQQGGAGLSAKTVRNVHAILRKALADAERWGVVLRNVADLSDPPKPTTKEQSIWTAEEVNAFLNATKSDRLQGAWHLAALTGMRRGEVLGLRWQDLDLDGARLLVRQTLISVNYKIHYSTPKTKNGRRALPLDPGTVAVLRSHRTRQRAERLAAGSIYEDNSLVFAQEDGTPIHPDGFTQRFNRLTEAVKLPTIRLHDLRHTYATLSLEAGVPTEVVSKLLGHATAAFTSAVYTHVTPKLEEAAVNLVADLIAGASSDRS